MAIVATYLCEGNTACDLTAWAWIGSVSGAAGAAANGGNILAGVFTGLITAYAGGIGGGVGFFARSAAGGISRLPNDVFNIPIYKVIFLHVMGGVPGVVLFLAASFLYERSKISVASIFLYVLLSVFSLKYFYDSFYIVQWHSFFYWMMFTVNFIFSIGCIYFFLKNRVYAGVREPVFSYMFIFLVGLVRVSEI